MIILVLLMCFLSSIARADIFKVDGGASEPTNENITSGAPRFEQYARNDLTDSLDKKFVFKDNLNQDFIKPLFGSFDVDQMMLSAKSSPLMKKQYEDPAAVDLLKFYTTIAHLRLGVLYQQAHDLEKEFGGTLDTLRRQGIYDCLREPRADPDLSRQMSKCLSKPGYFGALFDSEQTNGWSLDVLVEVFNRLHNSRDKTMAPVQEISPAWVLSRNGYALSAPLKRIGQVYAGYRKDFLEVIKTILNEYNEDHEASDADLAKLSLPTAPLTTARIRDLAMMDADEQEVLISQWASSWAKVKTTAQYELALEWFERARLHPLVKVGFKAVIEEDKRFVLNELDSFRKQMDSYTQYAGFMKSFLDTAEVERLKTIAMVDQAKQSKFGQESLE